MESSHHDSESGISQDVHKDNLKSTPLDRMDSVTRGEVGDVSRIPESLRELDADEIASLNKKLVRKMDLVILPISKPITFPYRFAVVSKNFKAGSCEIQANGVRVQLLR